MAYPEKLEPTREYPHLEKIEKIIQNAEREIQKECLSTGQPWINGYITQWNILLGQLELAELEGEINKETLDDLKENFRPIKDLVDGTGNLRQKYQQNTDLMPQSEKAELLNLLNILPALHEVTLS